MPATLQMKLKVIAVIVAWITIAVVCRGAARTQAASAPQVVIANVATAFAARDIARLEIVHVHTEETPYRISPEVLQDGYQYKVTIREIEGTGIRDSLVRAIAATAVKPVSQPVDLRWAITFYSRKSGERVASVGLDRTGVKGVVDKMPVSITPDLYNWLNSTFSTAFR